MTFSGKSFASWHLSVAMEKRLSLKLWVRTRQKKARIMHAVGRVDYSILEVVTMMMVMMMAVTILIMRTMVMMTVTVMIVTS